MNVVKPKAKELLWPVTTAAINTDNLMKQSELKALPIMGKCMQVCHNVFVLVLLLIN